MTIDRDEAEAELHADGTAAACLLLDIVRRLRAAERGYLADCLHDGPIQELAVASLELDVRRRATGPPMAQELGVAARQLEAAGRSLRRLLDELWPFPQAGSDLAAVLGQQTAWLLPAPLTVDLGEGTARLRPAEVQVIADLAELMLLGAAEPDPPRRVLAAVRADAGLIVLELNITMAPGGDPRAWLEGLGAAMRASAEVEVRGHRVRARIALPRRPQP